MINIAIIKDSKIGLIFFLLTS